jgi:hypothetical protein
MLRRNLAIFGQFMTAKAHLKRKSYKQGRISIMNYLEYAVAMGGVTVGTAAIYTCFKGNRRRSWQFLSAGLALI